MSENQSLLQKGIAILELLSFAPNPGLRLTDIATQLGLSQATTYRLVKTLLNQQLIKQSSNAKSYTLSLQFFSLAARNQQLSSSVRSLSKPSLLKISASLKDSVYLLLRHEFDMVCVDKIEGAFPSRSLTAYIGGKLAIGAGQGSIVVLAMLPKPEQDAIIQFNLPRMYSNSLIDEPYLRSSIAFAQENGYFVTLAGGAVDSNTGGVAVPITDVNGYPVGALSIGALSSRLSAERLPYIVDILKTEAQCISQQLNPFDAGFYNPVALLSQTD